MTARWKESDSLHDFIMQCVRSKQAEYKEGFVQEVTLLEADSLDYVIEARAGPGDLSNGRLYYLMMNARLHEQTPAFMEQIVMEGLSFFNYSRLWLEFRTIAEEMDSEKNTLQADIHIHNSGLSRLLNWPWVPVEHRFSAEGKISESELERYESAILGLGGSLMPTEDKDMLKVRQKHKRHRNDAILAPWSIARTYRLALENNMRPLLTARDSSGRHEFTAVCDFSVWLTRREKSSSFGSGYTERAEEFFRNAGIDLREREYSISGNIKPYAYSAGELRELPAGNVIRRTE